MTRIAILGFGGRGRLYAACIKKFGDGVKLEAVADVLNHRLVEAQNEYGVKSERCFASAEDFFRAGKIADAVVISTLDAQHHSQILTALALGYDVLLEKPIAPTQKEVTEILASSKKYNCKVSVCHVLRYTPFFAKIKEILDSGEIGDIVHIDQTENVGYYHQAHSFVRGNWRRSDETCPMILAKCCHDMDILLWLAGEKCNEVSSYGSLKFFKPECAPEGSADYCVDCKLKESCAYSCFKIYTDRPSWMIAEYDFEPTRENIYKKLSDKTYPYSRCVFKCDNDVVDHQVVNIKFDNDVTAHLTLCAFSRECFRSIKIFGTYGEIEGRIESNEFTVTKFGEPSRKVVLDIANDGVSVHSGGDWLLFKDFISLINNEPVSKGITSLENSVQSHLMAFSSEQSRVSGGSSVKI